MRGVRKINKSYVWITFRLFIVILSVIVGAFAVFYLGRLTLPFIFGFLLALLLNPLVDFLQKNTKMPRGLAVLTSIILITGVISTIITLLVNEIIQGFNYLSTVMPGHYEEFTMFVQEMYSARIFPFYKNLITLFQGLDASQQNTVLDSMQFLGEKFTNAFSSIFQSLGNGFYLVFRSLPNLVAVILFSLLAAFFISKDWHRIVRQLHERVPSKVQQRINEVHQGLQRALFGFLKAEFKITLISAVIVFIGLLILRVEHALTIALIIWLVDFLPYLGAILIFLPWAIYCFSTGEYFLGTGLAILYGLIVVQRQLIKPKILSANIGISPLMTLLTLYVGFKLLGFIGIVVGPLSFILLKIFYDIGILHDIWHFIRGRRGKILTDEKK